MAIPPLYVSAAIAARTAFDEPCREATPHDPNEHAPVYPPDHRYYVLLIDRVRAMAAQGKTLDQLKAELKMPEADDWVGCDRCPNNVEAAWRTVQGN